VVLYMKVLIISHYLNFNLKKKTSTNVFPHTLLSSIKYAGGTYVVCNFRKTEILANIQKGCTFILNFEEASTENAIIFNNNKHKQLDRQSPLSHSESETVDALDIMFNTLREIEKQVPMYPPVYLLQLIKSKTYLTLLPNKTKIFMPHTKTFMYYKTTVSNLIDYVCRYFNRNDIYNIVIKFGYSGDSEHVFVYSIDRTMRKKDKSELMDKMAEYSHQCGRTYLVIVQPFNPIINNRLNEYRCLFTGGVMSPIAAFGFTPLPNNTRIFIPSIELNPNNIDHAKIITLARYGYTQMCNYIGFSPTVLRIDISWVMDNGVKRYYINEFEGLSGTYYFNTPYVPKELSSMRLTDLYECTSETCREYPRNVQTRLAQSLVRYIYINSNLKKK